MTRHFHGPFGVGLHQPNIELFHIAQQMLFPEICLRINFVSRKTQLFNVSGTDLQLRCFVRPKDPGRDHGQTLVLHDRNALKGHVPPRFIQNCSIGFNRKCQITDLIFVCQSGLITSFVSLNRTREPRNKHLPGGHGFLPVLFNSERITDPEQESWNAGLQGV